MSGSIVLIKGKKKKMVVQFEKKEKSRTTPYVFGGRAPGNVCWGAAGKIGIAYRTGKLSASPVQSRSYLRRKSSRIKGREAKKRSGGGRRREVILSNSKQN